jgi:hypothetical protein
MYFVTIFFFLSRNDYHSDDISRSGGLGHRVSRFRRQMTGDDLFHSNDRPGGGVGKKIMFFHCCTFSNFSF